MEKTKIIIKGKHYDAGYTDFCVKTKGDLNIIANGLAMVLCDICIDGGMTRRMIYHGDNGWILDDKNI